MVLLVFYFCKIVFCITLGITPPKFSKAVQNRHGFELFQRRSLASVPVRAGAASPAKVTCRQYARRATNMCASIHPPFGDKPVATTGAF